MIRFRSLHGTAFILLGFLVLSLFGCMTRMKLNETARYRLYENVNLSNKNFGTWTKTDVDIPQGAIIAVMAKGEIRRRKGGQPYRTLRFRVGEDGREMHIVSGTDSKNPSNLNVAACEDAGFLYLGVSTWRRNKVTKTGEIKVRIMIWEKDHQDQIESDLLGLIRAHPKDQQFQDLIAYMARCLGNIGEYQKVQDLYKMMKENPKIEWDRVFPMVLLVLSNFERSLGRNDRAKAYLEESLQSARRYGNRGLESTILSNLAIAGSKQEKYEEANLLFEQSLKIAMEINKPRVIGECLWKMGQNLLRMNKPSEAVEHFEKSLEQFNRRDWDLLQRWVWLNLGEAYIRINKNKEAQKSFESAIEVALKAGDPQPRWRAHQWLGRIAEREGDEQTAFEQYARAITIIEAMRAKYTDPGLKALFMTDKFRLYDRMIRLLYKMKRAPEALHYLERAKARMMLDMLSEKGFSSKNKEENELLIQERLLRKRIDEVLIEREWIALDGPQELEEEVEEVQGQEKPISELERLQTQHRAVLEQIEQRNPELASLITINPLKAKEIQMLLDGETALLEYFLGVEGRFVFLVTRKKVLAVPLEVDSEELFEKIKDFRARAVDNITLDRLIQKTYEAPLSDLYQILIQPVEEEIAGKKNLVIVPHGMLHYIPFQALLSRKGKYLIESFAMSYLPSASVLSYARTKNKGNRMDLFAAGNPATGLSPLPGSEVEVREVSVLFDKRLVLTGQQATKVSVKSQSPLYDMILLSTHAEMIESDPLNSNLRFTPSEKDDGRLRVNEIFDMEIKASLVTLSACETALVRGEAGNFPQGDDLVGLSRAFIHAGAPSVVASLWDVSDDSTVELMKAFYRNLKTMSKSEALRNAQLDLMGSNIRFHVERGSGGITQSTNYQPHMSVNCSHPFFWAPFILIGDWR